MSNMMVPPPRFTGLRWYPYFCPVCGDEDNSIRPCLCGGSGVVTAEQVSGWPADELVAVPRPAAVRKDPCLDCAVRPGSPERENDPELRTILREDGPFWCHQGTADVRGEHVYTLCMDDGAPIGSSLCAGWFDWLTTGKLPTAPYRELEPTRERLRAARRARFAETRVRQEHALDAEGDEAPDAAARIDLPAGDPDEPSACPPLDLTPRTHDAP